MAQYGNMTLRERENKLRKRNEERAQDSSDASVREIKRSRKLNPLPKRTDRAKYDEKGLDKETGLDICDCLQDDCPGCWMNCANCGSRKCGHECRVKRRYRYEYIEIEGTDIIIKNKLK